MNTPLVYQAQDSLTVHRIFTVRQAAKHLTATKPKSWQIPPILCMDSGKTGKIVESMRHSFRLCFSLKFIPPAFGLAGVIKMEERQVKIFKNLLRDESGQDLIEYALVAALIALGAIAAMKGLAGGINTAFSTISSDLNSAVA